MDKSDKKQPVRVVRITLEGKEYPCRVTMGALLRFKRETGRELSEMSEGSLSDVLTYLWCCVCSACAADGIAFDYSLDDFADRCTMEDVNAWSSQLSAEDSGKKKK